MMGLDIIQRAVEAADSLNAVQAEARDGNQNSSQERRSFPRHLSNCRIAVVPGERRGIRQT